MSNDAPASGWQLVGAAVPLLFFAGVLIVNDVPGVGVLLAYVLGGVGCIFAAIGATAVGVTVGLRRAHWLDR